MYIMLILLQKNLDKRLFDLYKVLISLDEVIFDFCKI